MRGWVASEIWNHPHRYKKREGAHPAGTGGRAAQAGDRPKTFPFDEIVEANRYLESNQQVGKIVVTM